MLNYSVFHSGLAYIFYGKFEYAYYLYGDQSSALEIDRHKYTMFRERLLSLNVTLGVNNRKIVCLLPRDYTPYVFYGLR